jgi:hypothetical protein
MCKYLCSGKSRFHSDHYQEYDFYICDARIPTMGRTIIARFGDDGPDYCSSPLFCSDCCLTTFDILALYNGLELTSVEEKRLATICIKIVKSQTFSSVQEYLKNAIRDENDIAVSFGKHGNLFFSKQEFL